MAKIEKLPPDAYRFVAVLTWKKGYPDRESKVHQDKITKDTLANLLGVQPPQVLNTFTFNLCGERTLLITGYTRSPGDLDTFINMITGGSHITVHCTAGNDQVESVVDSFQGPISPEPGGHRFVANLTWDKKDDDGATKRIREIVMKVQNQDPQDPEIPGINKVMQCCILVEEQTAWIVGFAYETRATPSEPYLSGPDNLQRFISRIVYKQMIDAKVSHATSGPVVNEILNKIPNKK
jgi:hypothetical protein